MTGTWDVHEGPPSWHQRRAGHISGAATTGFATREDAEAFAAKLQANHPDKPTGYYFVLPGACS